MPFEPLRVGILSAAGCGTAETQAIQQCAAVCLVAATDGTAIGHGAAAQPEVPVCSQNELLAREDLEAVLVASPLHSRAALVLAALRAGKHVLAEAPLSASPEEVEELRLEARQTGLWLVSRRPLEHQPALRSLREQVAQGAVGQPAMLHFSWELPAAANCAGPGVPQGDVLLTVGVQQFDWLLDLLGPAERIYTRTASRGEAQAGDYALTSLRFASGAIAEVESSCLAGIRSRLTLEIAGDAGLLSLDSAQSTAIVVEAGCAERDPFGPAGTLPLELEQWAHRIRTGEPPVAPQHESRSLCLALAAFKSAACSKVVTL